MSESQVHDLLGCFRVFVAKQQTPGAHNQNSEDRKIEVSSDHDEDQESSSGPSLDDPEVKSEEEDEQRTTQIVIRPWIEDDDGLRTPTSSEFKIPETKQCPPAPRKPIRPHPMKRTAAPFPNVRRRLRLVQFQEVEQLFIFPPVAAGQFHRKIKRARTESMEKIA